MKEHGKMIQSYSNHSISLTSLIWKSACDFHNPDNFEMNFDSLIGSDWVLNYEVRIQEDFTEIISALSNTKHSCSAHHITNRAFTVSVEFVRAGMWILFFTDQRSNRCGPLANICALESVGKGCADLNRLISSYRASVFLHKITSSRGKEIVPPNKMTNHYILLKDFCLFELLNFSLKSSYRRLIFCQQTRTFTCRRT